MKEFEVEIQEILSSVVPVKAETLEEAVIKVKNLYDDEKIVLDSENFMGVSFEPYESEKYQEPEKQHGGGGRTR